MKSKKLIFYLFFMFTIIGFSFPLIVLAAEPTINSSSAILIETSTQKILYEKNSTEILFPASLTKVMTAALVLENCDLEEKAIVTESAVSNIPERICYC